MRRAVFLGLLSLLTELAAAADYRVDAKNYRDYLRRLQPGDRVLPEAGDYRQGLPLSDLSGHAARQAVNPAAPPRFIARPSANTVSLVNVRHLVLRHVQLDGRNLPVDAVKAESHSRYADFITLEHLYIHDHAVSQQNVGISTKSPAFGGMVRNNRIERVGTGMYCGDSDGSDPFVGGLIEANRITLASGVGIQVRRADAAPRRLPDVLAHELAAYPDWQGAELPGARVAATLLRTLGGAQQ